MKLEQANLWTHSVEASYEFGKPPIRDSIILHPEAWERVRAEEKASLMATALIKAAKESADRIDAVTDAAVKAEAELPLTERPFNAPIHHESRQRAARLRDQVWEAPNILLLDISQLPLDAPVVDESGRTLRKCLGCGFVGNFGEITSEAHEHSDSSFRSSDYTPAELIRDLFQLIDQCPHVRFWMPWSEGLRDIWPCDLVLGDGVVHEQWSNVRITTPTIRTQADADRWIPEVLKCRDLCGEIGLLFEFREDITISADILAQFDVCLFQRTNGVMLWSAAYDMKEQAQAAGVRVEEVERE